MSVSERYAASVRAQFAWHVTLNHVGQMIVPELTARGSGTATFIRGSGGWAVKDYALSSP